MTAREKGAAVPAGRRYDLVIVGAGTGGIPCAIEAAARGARVLPVEKDSRIASAAACSSRPPSPSAGSWAAASRPRAGTGPVRRAVRPMNDLLAAQWPPPVAADDRTRRYVAMIRHIIPVGRPIGTGIRSDG